MFKNHSLGITNNDDALFFFAEGEGYRLLRARNGRIAYCQVKSTYLKLAPIPVVIVTAGGNLIKVMDLENEDIDWGCAHEI